MTRRGLRLAVGDRIGAELTVLGAIDDAGPDPLYLVWNHRAFCPMTCKLYRSARRMAAEANVLAALSHPNLVRFFGCGQPPHLLMEFLEGPSLRQLLKRRPHKRLGISDSLRVAIHLCAALVHIHERGFLHLDIKPSNIIIARGGRPVLFDFGIARPSGTWHEPRLEGSDPYMAPEQCRREAVGPASDIFGLGATLYEMLSGELPFPPADHRHPFPQTVADPVPLRARRARIAAEFDRLVLRCLMRDPAARPASPAELATLLHPLIQSGPPMWPPGFQPAPSQAQHDGHRPRCRLPARCPVPASVAAERPAWK